jgi:hypothetical protein
MKYLRVALLVFASALYVARAQDDQQERQRPPTEIPDFSNLDEYIYEPKSTVKLGFRHLSGAKAKFSNLGSSSIPAPEDIGPATGGNLNRFYHDGHVLADARTTPRLDASGNPILDPQTGVQISDPIPPDGKTNNWSYVDQRQLDLAPNGFIAFHSYSADITDTATRSGSGRSSNGMDLSVTHDMGNLFHSRLVWRLMAGMSVNDISAKTSDKVAANLTTITDLYSLYGDVPPAPPYSSPSSTSQSVLDANGQTVTNADGTVQSVTVDTSVLIGNEPTRLNPTTAASTTAISDRWKVKGSYYTFRGGAELSFPVTSRIHADFGLGAAMIYSGTSYTVSQTFTPDIGSDITQTDSSSVYKLLPGYYADASLQFDVTEKTGFFAGAVFQSAGSYTQNLNTTTTHYVTKIDLSNQNGLRAGMSVRF